MNNDRNLEIVSEILQGVTVVRGSFGSLYLKHLSQFEQREVLSQSKIFEKEGVSKGLLTEKQGLQNILDQDMWSLDDENLIKNLKKEIDDLKLSSSQVFLPSQQKQFIDKSKEKEKELFSLEKEKSQLIGLTSEKYARNKVQKTIVNKILFYDRGFNKGVYEDLYLNENMKEAELFKLQKDFFEKFEDSNISEAVLSDYFSMYLPFCEDVMGVFGKPLADLTSYQLKLISFGRYFLNIFKNSQKEIPDNIAKDPELLIAFHQNQRNERSKTKAQSSEGGSAFFGASKEDIQQIKSNDERAVDLNEEVKKQGGSLNMEQMMKLHGV
tara:strand:- start:492 stop:1466 length:975 start_codon:yes stop_codon:yes gene_type:complete